MNPWLMELADLLKDNAGKVVILAGIGLVVIGVLAQNSFGTIESAMSFFFGFLFIFYGFFIQVGLFQVKLRSLGGIGTLLLCVSVGFFALAIVAVQFQDLRILRAVQEFFKGARLPFSRVLVASERPYLWLFSVSLQYCVAFFVAALVFKILHALRR